MSGIIKKENDRLLRLELPRIAAFAHLLEKYPAQRWIKRHVYNGLQGKQAFILEARQAGYITEAELLEFDVGSASV